MDEIFDIFDVLDSAGDLADVGDIADISELASALDAFDFTEFDGDMFQEILNLDIGDSVGMVDNFQADYLSESLYASIDVNDMSSMLEYSHIDFDGIDNIDDVYGCAADVVASDPFTLTTDPDFLVQDAIAKIPDTFMEGPYANGPFSEILYHDYPDPTKLGYIDSETGQMNLFDNIETMQETIWHEAAHGHFLNDQAASDQLLGAALLDDPMSPLDAPMSGLLKEYYENNYPPEQIPGEICANMFSDYMSKPDLFQQLKPHAFQVLESMKGMQA